jgi:hypothetical protein
MKYNKKPESIYIYIYIYIYILINLKFKFLTPSLQAKNLKIIKAGLVETSTSAL